MELSNERIKDELKKYLSENGVKSIFIARKINISPTSISLFLSGQRELPPDKLEVIYNIIYK